MSESERLGLLLEIQSQNKTMREIENFMDEIETRYKEFKTMEVPAESYTVDNLLDVIGKLNEKLQTLTDDYNCLVEDCWWEFNECLGLLPEHEVV